MNDHTTPDERTGAIYDAIDAFQRTHRLPGLQHAQIRGLLAEHLARALPAVSAVRPPATDRTAIVEGPQTVTHNANEPTRRTPTLPELADRAVEARVRALHQPMQRGPFTICAHCSGWDGEWRCLGLVTDYPCPTLRALDGECPQCGDVGDCNGGPCPLAAEPTAVGLDQPQDGHSCRNCEGVDPDTCLMNPDRPAVGGAQQPKTIRCDIAVMRRPHPEHDWTQRPDGPVRRCPGVAQAEEAGA